MKFLSFFYGCDACIWEGSNLIAKKASKALIHLFAIASAFISQLTFLRKSESLWSNLNPNSFSQSLIFIAIPLVFIVIESLELTSKQHLLPFLWKRLSLIPPQYCVCCLLQRFYHFIYTICTHIWCVIISITNYIYIFDG